MKKILFSLVALMCSMSMNAQVMKVMKGNVVVATYTADQADNVVFEEEQGSTTTGTAKATIGGSEVDVNWVQLWAGGPKFAEFNVGVTDGKAESYGGYYAWGGSQDMVDDHNTGTVDLTGDADTATKLWGSNWRMPTNAELDDLLANCDVEWTDNYKETGVKGKVFTGKGDYASNSVFLPAAGHCYCGLVPDQGDSGLYWSSTPNDSRFAYNLSFHSGFKLVYYDYRYGGYSVRAVLAEEPESTGTAKATIGDSEVDVNWVQLWENGPKFAEYNVGVTDGKAESYGGYYCWGSSIDKDPSAAYKDGTDALTGTDDTATNLWGNNWRMPTNAELDDLLANCDVEWTDNYKETGVKGKVFTGKGDFASNSVFLPAAGYFDYDELSEQGDNGNYWSSTPGDSDDSAYILNFDSEGYEMEDNYRDWGYPVRAVLKE